ncbi:MAG: GntR family transcriptional regulator [Actinomycetota bacterium]
MNRLDTYDRIKAAILGGQLEPGGSLIETKLAEQYGVSRTPVREALSRLEQDGLVERGPRGLTVRERHPEEILDIYETRIVLESNLARVAAERRTSFDLVRMRQRLEAARQKPRDGHEAAITNRSFHQSIWEAGHNAPLFDLLQRVDLHLLRYPATTLFFPGRWEQAHEEHSAILEAIDERDPNRAAESAKKHFTAARDIRLKLWEDGLA